MARTVILTAVLFLILFNTRAQWWGIHKQYSENSYGHSLSVSPLDSSICVSGNFTGPYYNPSPHDQGGFLIKYDIVGNLQWEKIYYSKWSSIRTMNVTDSKGNIFAGGFFSDNMVFENDSFDVSGLFLIKYDSAGNVLFKLHEPWAFPETMCIDNSDNIYLAGHFNTDQDTVFYDQVFKKGTFLAKYDNEGNFLWVKYLFFQANTQAFDIYIDKSGNIYSTGAFTQYGNLYITDSIQLTNTGCDDGFIAKYNSNVELEWVKTIKGDGCEIPKEICVNTEGDIYIAGTNSNSTISNEHYFDSITVYLDTNYAADIFLAKYNVNGDCQWVRTAGGDGIDRAWGLYVDNNGDAFLAGYFGWNGDSAVFGDTTFYCNNGIVMYLAQYDSSGSLKWIGASQGGQGYAEEIIGNGNGDLFVTGGFLGNWNFGPISLAGNEEMFLIKLNSNLQDSFNTDTTATAVAAQFYANKFIVCAGDSVSFTDSSTGNPSNWYWTFEGGAPAFSTAQNPVVVYLQPGSFYVKLTASDSINSDSLLMSSYITVYATPEVNLGNDTLLSAGDTIILDAQNPGAQYLWNNGNISQTLVINSEGVYSVTVTDQNGCKGTDQIYVSIDTTDTVAASVSSISQNSFLAVYPNPTRRNFTIRFFSSMKAELLVTIKNELSQTVYSESKKDFSGDYINTINLSGQSSGIYFVEVVCGEERRVKKIIVE